MNKLLNVYTKIKQAQRRMQQCQAPALRTPLTKSVALSKLLSANVYLKEENRQFTGSFKYRGALNKILTLSQSQREKGVVTASSGNHGMACASAASQLGIECQVFVPADASTLKVQRIQDFGAQVVKVDGDCLVAELQAQDTAQQFEKTYLSPYNDLDVIAGQGTIGLEITEDLPDVDHIFVSVGGGGLISGIGAALHSSHAQTNIIGCWPVNSPVLYNCLEEGKVVEVTEYPTLSDGTAGNVDEKTCTLDLCNHLITQKVLVSEDRIKHALIYLLEHEQLLVEGSAALAVAASIQSKDTTTGKNIVIVICGKNIGLSKLKTLL